MFGFITSSAQFGIGPERDHDFVLVSGMGAPVARLLRAAGHHAVSADEDPGGGIPEDAAVSSAAVLASSYVQHQLSALGCRALVPFKTSPRLAATARKLGIELLAPEPRLVRQLENKLSLPELAAEAGVRIPETRKVTVDDDLPALVTRPLVFQPAVGFAGAGTRLLASPADAHSLVDEAGGSVGKVTELVQGEPLTVNAVVVPETVTGDEPLVLVGAVARQLTGVPGCTSQHFGSAGNEWSLPLPDQVVAATRRLAADMGRVLAARGFAGTFGIDAIAAPTGDVVLIEVNPRCTASLSLTLQLQQLDGGPTLLDGHLAAFGWGTTDLPALAARFGADQPPAFAGASTPAASVIVFNPHDDAVGIGDLAPGEYRISDGGGNARLHYVQPAVRFDAISCDDHVLVLPQPSTRRVPAGAEMARLVFRSRVAADDACRSLLPHADAAVGAVRSTLLAGTPASA